MAKASKKASKKKTSKKAKATAGSAAVYLVTHKTKLAPDVVQTDIDRIHGYIKKAGGTCSLFGNKAKNADEFVSIIRALTPARQRQMVSVIEQSGTVKALRLHILKG